MELRRLGTSDVMVSPIIFGTSPFGGTKWGPFDDAVAVRALREGIENGIIAIDTAPAYGFGRSERVVGEAIRGRRDGVVIATKCGLRWDQTRSGQRLRKCLRRESVFEECDESLRRLGVEVIDLYQCHQPDPDTPIDETMEALLALRDRGKIRAIGVSNFGADLIERSLAVAPVASDQPKYNALDRRIERDLLPFCRERGVALIVYSSLGKGILTGAMTMERTITDHRRNERWFKPENLRRALIAVEKIRKVADGHGATLAQVMLNWTVHEPGITGALAGARNAGQAAENAGALTFALTAEERRFIRATFEAVGDPA